MYPRLTPNSIAKDVLDFAILLPSLLRCWDCKCMPTYLVVSSAWDQTHDLGHAGQAFYQLGYIPPAAMVSLDVYQIKGR